MRGLLQIQVMVEAYAITLHWLGNSSKMQIGKYKITAHQHYITDPSLIFIWQGQWNRCV